MREDLVYIDDVIEYLENTISPFSRQLDWDNSGKQLYFGNEKVSKVALALDPSAKAISSAIDQGCGLLITHHPLFFDLFKEIDFSKKQNEKIFNAISNRLSVVSFHTNFDVADFNLSDYIANLLGAKKEGVLDVIGSEGLYKFVVYVPEGFEDKIISAIDSVGAGTIGNYRKCTFLTHGTGTFEPQIGTNPFIGEIGQLERVNEIKVETIVKQRILKSLINSVINVHPYEEVAYDVYKLENAMDYGVGTRCYFEKPLDFIEFLNLLKKVFHIRHIRTNGAIDDQNMVNRFCIVAGSGASYWRKCNDLGYKLLVSGDLKHHDAIDAYENGIIIIDVGHFEMESVYMKYVAELLRKQFDIEIIVINETLPIKCLEE